MDQLENIPNRMSILFYTLMGALLDYLLFVLRMIFNMSSPIHAPSRRPFWQQKQQQHKEMQQTDSSQSAAAAGAENLLLDSLKPEPLTMLQLMTMPLTMLDVVNQMQEALHQCAASQNPPKPNAQKDAFHPCGAPSFCYFFIDLQPRNHFVGGTEEEFDEASSSHRSNDKINKTDEEATRQLQRQRSISECSEDSFICFEDDDNDNITCCDDDDDDEDEATNEVCDCSNNSTTPNKKVRFNLKPKVHVMHAWGFAYRAARKGDWEVFARDRGRFRDRIENLAPILNTILSSKHRETIYNDRFSKLN